MVTSCATETASHGYTFEQYDTGSISVGKTHAEEVFAQLGTPTSESDFGDKVIYYINFKTEKVAFFDPKVVEQRVLAISFNKKGIVSKIHEYTLDDRNQVVYSTDKTEIKGNTLTPIEQLLSNVGKFNKKK
jgi:outer membrane protein assembly factor BamE (lipoprotein component of BamABCDE complex)